MGSFCSSKSTHSGGHTLMESTNSELKTTPRSGGGSSKPQTQTQPTAKDNRNKHAAPANSAVGKSPEDRRQAAALAAEKRMEAASSTSSLLVHASLLTYLAGIPTWRWCLISIIRNILSGTAERNKLIEPISGEAFCTTGSVDDVQRIQRITVEKG